VIAGAEAVAPEVWDEARVRAALAERMENGEPLSSAARAIAAESGWERRAVYVLGVE
jgi:hypothetical protein